jgi:hypothetical protein
LIINCLRMRSGDNHIGGFCVLSTLEEVNVILICLRLKKFIRLYLTCASRDYGRGFGSTKNGKK